MHTCVEEPSMYPTYFISCLTTSSLGIAVVNATNRIQTLVGADRNISLFGLLASTSGCPNYFFSHFIYLSKVQEYKYVT